MTRRVLDRRADQSRGVPTPYSTPDARHTAELHEFSRADFSKRGVKGSNFHYRAHARKKCRIRTFPDIKRMMKCEEKGMEIEDKKGLHGSRNI